MFERKFESLVALARNAGVRRDDGQTLAEYALIIALLVLSVIVAMMFMSDQVSSLFSSIRDGV